MATKQHQTPIDFDALSDRARDTAEFVESALRAATDTLRRILRAIRAHDEHSVVPASEATFERFIAEEGPPVVMLTGAQTEQLGDIEQRAAKASGGKTRRASKT